VKKEGIAKLVAIFFLEQLRNSWYHVSPFQKGRAVFSVSCVLIAQKKEGGNFSSVSYVDVLIAGVPT
jgi:hypothetical protein